MGEETEACNRPSRMLTQLSREVTQIHKYTNAHNVIQNTNTHTRKVTQIHAITQIPKQNKQTTDHTAGEVVTTERSHKQWGAISGHRVGNGGNTQQGGKRA